MSSPQTQQALEIKFMSVEDLLLDYENPRLNPYGETSSQEELLRVLWEEMAVDELVLSIAANGYFKEEPLFVIPETTPGKKKSNGKYIVVEGNRRLSAVKLLLNANLRRQLRATDLPEIDEKARRNLENLPVSIYQDRKALWEYFGFRHVNGPMAWDSISKAAYITKVRRDYKIPLKEIARKIGDKTQLVERIYRGYLLLEQAERSTNFSREDIRGNKLYFSHLYTAARTEEVQKFLGLDPSRYLKDNPVPKDHLPQLEEFMFWLFGSRNQNKAPVISSQNPDLKQLGSILGNRQALSALRSGISLKRSYEISLGDRRRFQEAIVKAKDALQDVKGTVTTGYAGDKDLLKMMEDIHMLAKSILDEMRGRAKN